MPGHLRAHVLRTSGYRSIWNRAPAKLRNTTRKECAHVPARLSIQLSQEQSNGKTNCSPFKRILQTALSIGWNTGQQIAQQITQNIKFPNQITTHSFRLHAGRVASCPGDSRPADRVTSAIYFQRKGTGCPRCVQEPPGAMGKSHLVLPYRS